MGQSVHEAEFLRLYVEERLPGREVAARMGINMDRVYALKRRLGVATMPKWARRDLPSLDEDPLRSVLLGSMLGDGAISLHKETLGGFCFMESHSIAQRSYLEWKRSIWGKIEEGGWAGSMSEQSRGVLMAHPKQPDRLYQALPKCCFRTVVHGALRPWWEVFYRNADIGAGGQRLKKFKADEVVELVGLGGLTDIALAVWYADDGTAGHWPTITVGPRNKEQAGVLLRLWGFEPTETSRGWDIRGTSQATEFHRRVAAVLLPLDDVAYKVLNLGFWTVGTTAEDRAVATVAQEKETSEAQERLEDKQRRLEEVLRLGREGVAATDIARVLRFNRRTVVTALKQEGIEPVRARRPLLSAVCERAQSGEAITALAAEYDWSTCALSRRLDAAGVSRRERGGSVRADVISEEGLRAMLIATGGSVAEAARRVEVARDTIVDRIQHWGLQELVVHRKGAGRHVIELDQSEVLVLRSEGFTNREIAARFGVKESLVQLRLHQWGCTQPVKATDGHEIKHLLNEGLSMVQAAKRLGVPPSTASSALTRAGLWAKDEIVPVQRKFHRWKVHGPVGGVSRYLGSFETEEEAWGVYNEAVRGTPARESDLQDVLQEMAALGPLDVQKDLVWVADIGGVDVRTRIGDVGVRPGARLISGAVGPVYGKGWARRLGRAWVNLVS